MYMWEKIKQFFSQFSPRDDALTWWEKEYLNASVSVYDLECRQREIEIRRLRGMYYD
jgi:hypothetical protein